MGKSRRTRGSTRTRASWAITVAVLLIAIGLAGADYLSGSLSGSLAAPSSDRLSTAAGWYALHFTTPSYPDDPARHHGGLDERLVELIDRAQSSVDVAIYDFDLDNVAAALARARSRGVRVRVVIDSDTVDDTKNQDVQRALATLRAAEIPITADRRSAIMHNKYTIVDGEWLATGSWNYTDGDTYRLNNWLGIFHSRELARVYDADFAEMFAGRFGSARSARPARAAAGVADTQFQVCFSPDGRCGALIAETIAQEARSAIRFLAFSFTHDGIGRAISDRAAAGVRVGGVFETTGSQTPFSEYGRLKAEGLDVHTDGNPYAMHHKIILIDDRTVIAGSFNFSASADSDNDENVLIIRDAGIARDFRVEYDRVIDVAKNPPPK